MLFVIYTRHSEHWWCEISVSCVSKYLLYANIFHWNERHETTREGLPILCSELLPFDGLFPVIRTDPAPWVYCLNQRIIISQSSQINIIGSYLIINVFVAGQKTPSLIYCGHNTSVPSHQLSCSFKIMNE